METVCTGMFCIVFCTRTFVSKDGNYLMYIFVFFCETSFSCVYFDETNVLLCQILSASDCRPMVK